MAGIAAIRTKLKRSAALEFMVRNVFVNCSASCSISFIQFSIPLKAGGKFKCEFISPSQLIAGIEQNIISTMATAESLLKLKFN